MEWRLEPGTKVVIIDRNSDPIMVAEATGTEYDGIIDPFNDGYTADIVWMLVAPSRMITGVRHDWDLTDSLAEDIEETRGDKFCCAGQRY